MRYLLDTHTALWALDDDFKLSEKARGIINNVSIELFVSLASVWEMAIKISIGKLVFAGGIAAFLERLKENGIKIIEIKEGHLRIVETLPFIHRDPFDRLLIASVNYEGLTIITNDDNIQKYNVKWIW